MLKAMILGLIELCGRQMCFFTCVALASCALRKECLWRKIYTFLAESYEGHESEACRPLDGEEIGWRAEWD